MTTNLIGGCGWEFEIFGSLCRIEFPQGVTDSHSVNLDHFKLMGRAPRNLPILGGDGNHADPSALVAGKKISENPARSR